jgi:tetratricopeptide (TPR) repeat protein
MEKNLSSIIEDLIKELKKFLPATETEKFVNLFQNAEGKIAGSESFSDENLYQVSRDVDSGSDIREQIDKLITFAENKVSQKQYLLLLISISELLINYGEFDLCEDIITDIQKQSREAKETVILADSWLQQSKVEWNQGNWDSAKRACTKAALLYSSSGNDIGMAKCENVYGTIYGEQGDINKAAEHFKQGLEFQKFNQNDTLVLHLTNNLAIISTIKEDFPTAKKYYDKALLAVKKLKDFKAEARLNHNIAMMNIQMEKYEDSLPYFDKSINISMEKGYLTNCAISFIGKANAYSKLENQDLSDAFVEKALEISYKINDRLSIADAYRVKGIIQKNLNNYDLSAEFFENSIRLNEDFKSKMNEAESNIELAQLKKEKNEESESKELFNKAKSYFKKINAEEKLKSIDKLKKK